MSNFIYYENLEDYEKQVDMAKKYEKLRKKLLNSKLITDNEWNEYQKLKKDNNDLRRIYLNTAKKLEENGNDELARYFLAQIDMTPTFTVDPVIDYYKEYHKLLDKIKWLEAEIDDLEMQIGEKDV